MHELLGSLGREGTHYEARAACPVFYFDMELCNASETRTTKVRDRGEQAR
jgi:hypothetical protein